MIKELVNDWAQRKKRELIANYDRLGLRASGQFERDLEAQVYVDTLNIKVKFMGSAHTQQMIKGRGPNVSQDPERLKAFVGWAGSTFLKDWVNRKNVDISPYAIAYKIGREGIEVPSKHNPGTLVSDVINNEAIKKLANEIGSKQVGVLLNDIKITLKTDIK